MLAELSPVAVDAKIALDDAISVSAFDINNTARVSDAAAFAFDEGTATIPSLSESAVLRAAIQSFAAPVKV